MIQFNSKRATLHFGLGTIGFMCGIAKKYDNLGYMAFQEIENESGVGELTETVPVDYEKPIVAMHFENLESIDFVLKCMQEVREKMAAAGHIK